MEPRIQYAKAEDGVSIACYAIGHGPAIVRMPSIPWSHFQLQWQMFPEQRAVAELIAERFTYVEYDSRGTGSSARAVTDFALDAHVLDLEAVVNKLGLDDFALIGQTNSSPVAISYAVRNPQRISHLVLINGFARAADPNATPESRTFQALRGQDWTIFSESIAQFQTGWSGEGARDLAAWLREAVSQEVALASLQEIEKFDVTGILSQIQTPTLVTHQGISIPPVEFSRSLAAQIPDARLVIAEDSQGQVIAIGEFLGIDAELSTQGGDASQTRISSSPEAKTLASGRYVVKRLLGEGAQKSVYLVDDIELERECALSLIKGDLLDPDDLGRLRREAQAMARLTHANIVTVHDIGEEDGRPYVVCEYVPGGELRDELAAAAGPLPLERALTVAIDICRALSFAHGEDIVHRDLKPENIWTHQRR